MIPSCGKCGVSPWYIHIELAPVIYKIEYISSKIPTDIEPIFVWKPVIELSIQVVEIVSLAIKLTSLFDERFH